jgi:hypothetical protein
LLHGAVSGAFSPDGRVFASGAVKDGGITLWDVATGKKLRALEQPGVEAVMSLAFSTGGDLGLTSVCRRKRGLTMAVRGGLLTLRDLEHFGDGLKAALPALLRR